MSENGASQRRAAARSERQRSRRLTDLRKGETINLRQRLFCSRTFRQSISCHCRSPRGRRHHVGARGRTSEPLQRGAFFHRQSRHAAAPFTIETRPALVSTWWFRAGGKNISRIPKIGRLGARETWVVLPLFSAKRNLPLKQAFEKTGFCRTANLSPPSRRNGAPVREGRATSLRSFVTENKAPALCPSSAMSTA